MNFESDLLIAVLTLSLITFGIGLVFGSHILKAIDARIAQTTILVVAGIAILFEYYALGASSFIFMDDEGQITNPLYNYVFTRALPGQQFAHEFAGGNDLYSMFLTGMQSFSFERLFFSVLPHWAAVACQKGLTYTVAVVGAYLLARRACDTGRTTAAFLAIFYFLSDRFILNGGLAAGTGWVAPPLALYLIVWRVDKSHYFPGVALAAVFIVNASPTNVFTITVFTVVAGAILLGKTSRSDIARILLSLSFVVLLLALNWRENLTAMYLMAPLSARMSLAYASPLETWIGSLPVIRFGVTGNPVSQQIFILVLVVLLFLRDRIAVRAIAAIIVVIVLLAGIHFFPWRLLGLDMVRFISWNHIWVGLSALSIPLIARLVGRLDSHFSARRPLPRQWQTGAAIVAMALALFVWRKGENLYFFLHMSGQSQFMTIENLRRPDWKNHEPVRVVTMRDWQPEPNIVPGFYGIDSFDGEWNLIPKNVTDFWETMIRRSPTGLNRLYPTFGPVYKKYWSWSTFTYDLARQLSFDHLAMANVGYVILSLPLKPNSLKQVSGPKPKFIVQKTISDHIEYYRTRLDKIFEFGDASIFRIPNVLPRTYAATEIRRVRDTANSERWLSEVRKYGPRRAVVAFAHQLNKLTPIPTTAQFRILSHGPTLNGYDVDVEAPDGGLLVLNIPFLPFWRATVDERAAAIADVNIIHMAVSLPPGAKTVRFRYIRPRFNDLLFQ